MQPVDMPEPPAPITPPPPITPPTPPRQPGKLRAYIILGVIVAFLGVVLYMVRDNQSAADLAVGQCFDLPTKSTEITTVVKHDCTEPHDAEVFNVAEYTGSETSDPGSTAWDRYIDAACLPVFESYVGESVDVSETLTYGWFYPSVDSWNSGDRTYTCYASRIDEAKLTQTIKGSAGS